jgi:hypothetical protein
VTLLKLASAPQSSRLSSLDLWRQASVPLLDLLQFCPEEWKQHDANSLLALTGRAGSRSRRLPGNDLECSDGLHFQEFFLGGGGWMLSSLLSFRLP